jgi:hypothetical protein
MTMRTVGMRDENAMTESHENDIYRGVREMNKLDVVVQKRIWHTEEFCKACH